MINHFLKEHLEQFQVLTGLEKNLSHNSRPPAYNLPAISGGYDILLIGGLYDHIAHHVAHQTWSIDIIEYAGDTAIASHRYDFVCVEVNSGCAVFKYVSP